MKLIILLFLFTQCVSQAQHAKKLPANDFEKKLAQTPEAQVLDVRTKTEFSDNHLKNALNADYNNPVEFEERTKFLDKGKPVFVYCLAGSRSAKAAELLANQGFTVYDLQGGMNAWRNANKPYEKSEIKKLPGMSVMDFEKKIADENLILVDFGAKWCPPCKKLNPILEEILKENSVKLKLLNIDVDENELLSKAKNIETLPVLMLYKNGKLVWKQEGFADKVVIQSEIDKF